MSGQATPAKARPTDGLDRLPQSTEGWLHLVDNETAKAWQAGYAQGQKRSADLTRTELEQLLAYAQHSENEGWYWGNAKQFRQRHDKLKAWITARIDAAASR